MLSEIRRGNALATAVAVVLILEVAVATLALGASRPARWGWQMYSGAAVMPNVWVIEDDGARPVNVGNYLIGARAEIDWSRVLPGELCEIISAEAIRIEMPAVHSRPRIELCP